MTTIIIDRNMIMKQKHQYRGMLVYTALIIVIIMRQ